MLAERDRRHARPSGVGAEADDDGLPVSLEGLPAAHLRALLDGLPVFERYGLLLAGDMPSGS
jgi:hypothetical protein